MRAAIPAHWGPLLSLGGGFADGGLARGGLTAGRLLASDAGLFGRTAAWQRMRQRLAVWLVSMRATRLQSGVVTLAAAPCCAVRSAALFAAHGLSDLVDR